MADSCYSLITNMNCGGQFAVNVFHYHFDDAGFLSTSAAAHALITSWITSIKPAYIAIIPNETTILSIRSRKVSAVGGFEFLQPLTTANVGLRTGVLMASGVSPLLIFLPLNNAKQRGKCFLPGITNDDLVDGCIIDTYRSAVESHYSALISSITLTGGGGPTAVPVIYSRKNNTWQGIDAVYLSMKIGRQRRRQLPV